MSKISIDTITNRDGSHGPVISGVTTITGNLKVGSTGAVSLDTGTASSPLVRDSSGLIGIGTDNPQNTLHVNSTVSDIVGRFQSTDAKAVIRLADNTGSVDIGGEGGTVKLYPGGVERFSVDSGGNVNITGVVTAASFSGSQSASGLIVTGIATVSAGSTASPSIQPSGDGNTGIFFPAADTIAFSEGGSEALRIDSSGNVGVNTTSVTFGKLQVTQSSDTDEGGIGIVDSTISRSLRLYCTSSNAVLNSGNGGSGTLILNEGTGRIGIGTDDPTAGTDGESDDLVIHRASGAAGMTIKTASNAAGSIRFADTDGTSQGRIEYSHASDFLRWNAGGSEKLRIDSNANLILAADTNTFIGHPASDTLALTTGGTERARIDSSGRLGIGTNTAITTGANALLQVGTLGGGQLVLGRTDDSSIPAGQDMGSLRYFSNAGGTQEECAAITAEADGTQSAGDKPTRLRFATTADGASSATERMRIGSNGQVRITGTMEADANNAYNLVIFGDDAGTNGESAQIFLGALNVTTRGAAIAAVRKTGSNDHDLVFKTSAASATPTERGRIDSSGRLGLGTTTPAADLHVNAASGDVTGRWSSTGNTAITYLAGTSDTVALLFGDSDDSDIGQIRYENSDDSMGFVVNNSARAVIDASGRLLVGTQGALGSFPPGQAVEPKFVLSDPLGAVVGLYRNDTTIVSGNALGGIYWYGNDTTGNTPEDLAGIACFADGDHAAGDNPTRLGFYTTSSGSTTPLERLTIFADGTVQFKNGGIEILSTAISSGAGNSTLKYDTTSGAVTYDTSSRLVKENIVDCPYGLDAVKLLQPRKYFRTDDQRDEIGFIADELVSILPEFVPIGPKSVITKNEQDTEDVPLGVNYEKLTAVLTKALQEAIGRIETLEQRLTDAGIA